LQLNAVFSWLDARYSNFSTASVPSALKPFLVGSLRYDPVRGTYDASGNYLNYAPRFSGLLGAEYNWQLASAWALFVHSDISYQSRAYFDPSNSPLQSQGGYAVWNASAGLRSREDGWLIELWGRNLADKPYLVAIVASSLEPAGVAGPPRTFGIRISKSW
jgi:iron complex outermembrane receptor protein